MLEPEIFEYMEAGKNYDFSQDIFPFMLRDGKPLYGLVATDYWTDIGNLQQYQQANYDALAGAVRVEIPGTQIAPGIWAGRECRTSTRRRSLHGPLVLGQERDDRARRRRSKNSARSATRPSWPPTRSCIERSRGRTSTSASRRTLTGCTLADRVIVKDRVSIAEGAVIGRGSTLGSGATVPSNIKLWPDKSVASGAIVSMSLIYGIKWPGSLFGDDGVAGLANIEITPEFALKLGQAFGSTLKPGQSVMTSRDTHPASRLMNRCVIAGLLSVGVNVQDLREMPTPMSRYAVRNVGRRGRAHGNLAARPERVLDRVLRFVAA